MASNSIVVHIDIVNLDVLKVFAFSVHQKGGMLQISAASAADPEGPHVALSEMSVSAAQAVVAALQKAIEGAALEVTESVG